jgi:hypothetical protein
MKMVWSTPASWKVRSAPAQLVGRADAVGASAEHLGADLIAHGLERRPDVRAPGFVLAEDVVVSESDA